MTSKKLIPTDVALPVKKPVGTGEKYEKSDEVMILTKDGIYDFAKLCKILGTGAVVWRAENCAYLTEDVIGWLPKQDLPKMPPKGNFITRLLKM